MNTFKEVPASKKSLVRRKPVLGRGINDADYNVTYKDSAKSLTCPIYQKWVSMLTRCYSTKYQERYPAYIGSSVAGEWLTFSCFRKWMKVQDWKNKQLDKDLLIPGNKIYSPETCVFVNQSLNKLLTDSVSARGEHPKGVCFYKASGKYQAQCNIEGKKMSLGYFSTSGQASQAYLEFKSSHIKQVAKEYLSNKLLYNALINHANLMERSI